MVRLPERRGNVADGNERPKASFNFDHESDDTGISDVSPFGLSEFRRQRHKKNEFLKFRQGADIDIKYSIA